jgi:hypothetical protein
MPKKGEFIDESVNLFLTNLGTKKLAANGFRDNNITVSLLLQFLLFLKKYF